MQKYYAALHATIWSRFAWPTLAAPERMELKINDLCPVSVRRFEADMMKNIEDIYTITYVLYIYVYVWLRFAASQWGSAISQVGSISPVITHPIAARTILWKRVKNMWEESMQLARKRYGCFGSQYIRNFKYIIHNSPAVDTYSTESPACVGHNSIIHRPPCVEVGESWKQPSLLRFVVHAHTTEPVQKIHRAQKLLNSIFYWYFLHTRTLIP